MITRERDGNRVIGFASYITKGFLNRKEREREGRMINRERGNRVCGWSGGAFDDLRNGQVANIFMKLPELVTNHLKSYEII